MKYKLIAIDIDGTLLSPHGTITDKNYESLKSAIDLGIIVVLCTGRSYFMTQKVLRQLEYASMKSETEGKFEFELPLILHNGAQIVNSTDGQIIAHWALSKQTARRAVALMKELNLEPIAYDFCEGKHILVYESIDKTNEAYVRYMSTKESILHQTDDLIDHLDHNPTQLVAINLEPIIKDAVTILKKHLKDANVFTSGSLYTTKEYWFLEVLVAGASKAKALQYLIKQHHIDRTEVMAIGDNFNDLDMIQYAGLSVAMGNAPDEIKEQADFVTDSNSRDGVAKAIEKFLLC